MTKALKGIIKMKNQYLVAAQKYFNKKIYKADKEIFKQQGELAMLEYLQQYVTCDIRGMLG